ncbi:MAG: hypothetical protein U0230_21345 [Polyangiales bacterium]
MQPPKRRRGPLVVFVFVSLIATVVATALGFWWRGREPMGPVLRLVGLDDHTVVVVRKGYRQRDYVHLTVRDLRSGEQRWKMALWNVLEYADPLVRGDLVMLRVREQFGKPETHSFRLSTGQFVWRAGKVERGPRETVRGASVLGSRLLFEITGGRTAKIFAIEPEDGRVVYARELPGGDGPVHAVATGDGVAFDPGNGSWVRMGATDGEPEVLGSGSACTFGHGVFFLGAAPSEDGRPVRIAAATGGRRIVLCARAGTSDVLVLSGRAGTLVLTRPSGGDLFSIASVAPQPFVDDVHASAVVVPGVVPLPHPDGTLDLLDVASGRVRSVRMRSGRAPVHVAFGATTSAVVAGSDVVVLRAGQTEPLVATLDGDASGDEHVAVVGDVVYVARGDGIVGLDVASRSLVGISGPLGADFVAGGLSAVSTPVERPSETAR